MTRGLIRRSASYPKPRRSIAPGPKFSATTSARPTIRSKMARPRSVFRSSVTLFLLALRRRKNQASRSARSDSARRPGSPPGGSILMTSAPSQASISVQLGPASYCVRSNTTIPSSAFPMSPPTPPLSRAREAAPLRGWPERGTARLRQLRRVGREADRLRARLEIGHDVDDRGLARGPGPLERRPDLVGLLDELAVSAEILRDLVVARVAEVAPRLAPLRVGRPAAVVADDDDDGNPVADRRVDLHRVEPVRAVAVQNQHLRVGAGAPRAHPARAPPRPAPARARGQTGPRRGRTGGPAAA